MKIAIIVEGQTEKAFLPHLRNFLSARLPGRMPDLDPVPYNGRIPTGDKLKRDVERLLNDRRQPADAVIALTDVYTGATPPQFTDAAAAKDQLRRWVGSNDRFFPHAAQHDFEAWLLPFWDEIQRLAGHNQANPGTSPERVNHMNPPAHRLQAIFRAGNRGKAYVKPRDAGRILRGKDLLISAQACPELRLLLNTILTLCGAAPLSP